MAVILRPACGEDNHDSPVPEKWLARQLPCCPQSLRPRAPSQAHEHPLAAPGFWEAAQPEATRASVNQSRFKDQPQCLLGESETQSIHSFIRESSEQGWPANPPDRRPQQFRASDPGH